MGFTQDVNLSVIGPFHTCKRRGQTNEQDVVFGVPQDSQQLTICPERRPNLERPKFFREVVREMGRERRLTEQPYGTWAMSTIQRLPTLYQSLVSMRTEFRFWL